jgi:hypothetical protein
MHAQSSYLTQTVSISIRHVIGDCRLRVQIRRFSNLAEARVVYLRRRSDGFPHTGHGKVSFSIEVLPRTSDCQSGLGYVSLLCNYPEYAPEKWGGACAICILIAFLAQTSIVVAPLAVVRLFRCKMISFRYVCERFRV